VGLKFEQRKIKEARFQAIPTYFSQKLPLGYEQLQSRKGGLASFVHQL
jgi:hypothetical protein